MKVRLSENGYTEEYFDNQSLLHIMDTKKFTNMNSIDENPIHISNLKQYVKEALETGELERQYELFTREQTKPCIYGNLPPNQHKNRHKNLIPYDDASRVILQKIHNDPYSDYINASYIDGYKHKKAYIATQGPKPQTVIDFWRMVWQEESKFLFMLINVQEFSKKKCEQYWPNINEEVIYGDIRVFHSSNIVYADFICRKFTINRNDETRQVEQIHFVSWLDHEVPMYTKSILPLIQKLSSIPYDTPIIIHCSDGVAQTGTIILSDIVLRMAGEEEQIDVLYYLKQIRNQRKNLVGNIDQYILVHLIIVECLLVQQTNIICETSEDRYEVVFPENCIKKQMAQIDDCNWMDNAMRNQSQPIFFNDSTKKKNRFSTIVPLYVDDLIRLTPYSHNEIDEYTLFSNSEYINAVFVDGYRQKERFIATQQPLPSTLGDFWRLIMERDIQFIVSLNNFNSNNQTVADIYIENSEIQPTPYLRIKYIKKKNYVFYDIITVQVRGSSQYLKATQSRTLYVKIIQLTQWEVFEPLPNISKNNFVQFYKDVKKICGNNTILITCYDGALACGLFTALSFIIDQMNFEHQYDVPFAVRVIRCRRQNFIRSDVQLKYLYQIATYYIDNFNF